VNGAGRAPEGQKVAIIARLVSGGQTGVDRAALDVALALGIPCGGWCPKGRRAEDGRIPDRYPLTETRARDNATRTRWNVRDSDFTLVLSWGEPTGRTRLTLRAAARRGRPHTLIDLANPVLWSARLRAVREAITGVGVLNVTGPRESHHPRTYYRAKALLRRLLARS
jgi:hypothetical protein